MRTRGRSRLVAHCAALALLAVAAPALGQGFGILYHESVLGFAAVPGASGVAAGSAGKPQPSRSPSWSFVAFGRQFDVELEPNDRLVRGLARERRERLRDVELYSGRLAGLPGSWVRLVRHRGIVSGVIWDGATLYGVETESRVARYAVNPGTSEGDIAIYRWQDTTGVLRDEVIRPSGAAEAAPSDAERLALMTSPLPTPVGTGAQLDVAVVADEAFVQREGASAEATLLSIANIVDGIYVMQIGIHLNVAELVLLDAAGPFTQTDSRALLTELEEYKLATPAFRERGLVHLFTGRDLDESEGQTGQQVGIANLGVVCSERFGVALTQATLGIFSSALVAAHEIGHNFGAPHDSEPGSACELEPAQFLMAPSVSGSRAFSQCSIEQMAPEVAGASCLTPLPGTNLAIEVTQPPPPEVDQEEPFQLGFTIRNDGPETALDVEIAVAFAGLQGPELVETSGDDLEECGQTQPAYCRFPRLAPGEAVRYTLRFSALTGGPKTIDLDVSALNDTDASDNGARVTFDVRPFVDLATETDVAEVVVYADEEVRLSGAVRNVGLIAASGVVAELSVSYQYDIVDVDAGGATCVLVENGQLQRIQCRLGAVQAGVARPISWTVRPKPEHADDFRLVDAGLAAFAAETENAPADANNTASTRLVRTDAKGDLVAVVEAAASFDLGDAVQLVVRISNQGPDEARDIAAVYAAANDLGATIDSVSSSGGQCTVAAAATDFECRAAQLAAGESVVITFDGTAETLGTYRLSVAGSTGSGDPNTQNNIATHTFSIIDPAAPPSNQPSNPPSGSGGGGGGTGIAMLLGLLVAAGLRILRRLRRAVVLGAPLAAVLASPLAAAQDGAEEPGDSARVEDGLAAEGRADDESNGTAGPRPSGVDLPEGDGKALVQTACLPCHDLGGITAFKGYWNREQWAAMVATMIGHGAKLDAAQAEVVIDYLTAHFGVEEDHRQKRGMAE